jgi:hypothetical protein
MNILKRMLSFHSFCESFGTLFVFIFKFIAVKRRGLKQSLQKYTRFLEFQQTWKSRIREFGVKLLAIIAAKLKMIYIPEA